MCDDRPQDPVTALYAKIDSELVWVELLDSHRPPRATGDWASPPMLRLLQAAAVDPLLSSRLR